MSRSGRARDPRHPAILFKGSTLTYGELERLSDACAAALASLGVVAEIASRCCCPTARNSSSPSSARGRSARSSPAQSPLHRGRARRPRCARAASRPSSRSRATTSASSRFSRARRSVTSSRPTSRNIFRRFCDCCSRSSREKRDGDRVTVAPGDHDSARCLRRHSGRGRQRATITPTIRPCC